MSLPKVFRFASMLAVLLAGCSFFASGGKEAEEAKEAQLKVLYYQLAGHPEKGWALAEEERFKEVEELVVTASTMLGFRKQLHFDRLVPFESGHLKQDSWHLISFDQREEAQLEDGEGAEDEEEGGAAGASGSVLVIKLEWLNSAGEVSKVTVQVSNPAASPPSRDPFDELFQLYVASVAAERQTTAEPVTQEGDAGSAPASPLPAEPLGDAGMP